MTTKIFIILPVHNRITTTLNFLRCLKQQTYTNFHLILIDDGSTDGTAEMVTEQIDNELSVIKGDGELWWGGALQKGFEWLENHKIKNDDVVLISNDDVKFDKNYLHSGVSILDKSHNTLVCSRFYNPETGSTIETGVKANLRNLTFKTVDKPTEINCCSTRGLFIRWSDMRDIGPFRPKLLPHYLSDYEFTIRANKKGYNIITTNEVYLLPDLTETGVHNLTSNGIVPTIKMIFSKKYAGNPLYWCNFALIVAPLAWLPYIFVRIWGRFLLEIFRSIKRSSTIC